MKHPMMRRSLDWHGRLSGVYFKDADRMADRMIDRYE
jgi:hypothetical protein